MITLWLCIALQGYSPEVHLRAMLRGWDLAYRDFHAQIASFRRSETDESASAFLDHYVFDVRAGLQSFEFSALGLNGVIDSFDLRPRPQTNPDQSIPFPSEARVRQRVLAALKEIGVQDPDVESDLLYDPAKRFVEGRWTEGREGFPGDLGWFEMDPASGRLQVLRYPYERPSSWAPVPPHRVPSGVVLGSVLHKLGQIDAYPEFQVSFGPRLMWWLPRWPLGSEFSPAYTSLTAAEYAQGNAGRARLAWVVRLGYWSRIWQVVVDPSSGKVWEVQYMGEGIGGNTRKVPLFGLGPAEMEVGFEGRPTTVRGAEFDRTDAPKSFQPQATGWIRCAKFLFSFAYDPLQNRLRLGSGSATWYARPNAALRKAMPRAEAEKQHRG